MNTAKKLMMLLRGSGVAAPVITYLLRDEFTTDEAAPLTSPRTAEPGPGTLTIVDTNNYVSVTSNKLLVINNTTNYVDPRIYGEAQDRLTGKALMFTILPKSSCMNGWFANTSGGTSNLLGALFAGASLIPYPGGSINETSSTTIPHTVALVMRSAGGFVLVKGGAAFTDWTLLWPDVATTTTPLYPVFSGTGTADSWRDNVGVVVLPAPFDTDTGIATQSLIPAPADTALSHTADGFIVAERTSVTGEDWELDFRRTDDNNRWIMRASQSGSTVKLIELNAGSETERDSSAAAWANNVKSQVVIRLVGNVIKVYQGVSPKLSYTSAFNNTGTGTKTNRALNSFSTYPRTLTGGAASVLDSVNFT